VFLSNGSMIRRLASLHWLQPGAVRQLRWYYQDAMTSCRPSRRASFPSLGGTSVALAYFAPRRPSAPSRPGVGHPVSPAGIVRGNDRISQVPGESRLSVCTCSYRRRQDCLHQTITVQQRGPWTPRCKGSHVCVFRRPIAWLSDSLSTPRRVRYLTTTQDSLPVAGQALPDGLSTHKIPLRGF
jgi:hypothetical protein